MVDRFDYGVVLSSSTDNIQCNMTIKLCFFCMFIHSTNGQRKNCRTRFIKQIVKQLKLCIAV